MLSLSLERVNVAYIRHWMTTLRRRRKRYAIKLGVSYLKRLCYTTAYHPPKTSWTEALFFGIQKESHPKMMENFHKTHYEVMRVKLFLVVEYLQRQHNEQ